MRIAFFLQPSSEAYRSLRNRVNESVLRASVVAWKSRTHSRDEDRGSVVSSCCRSAGQQFSAISIKRGALKLHRFAGIDGEAE